MLALTRTSSRSSLYLFVQDFQVHFIVVKVDASRRPETIRRAKKTTRGQDVQIQHANESRKQEIRRQAGSDPVNRQSYLRYAWPSIKDISDGAARYLEQQLDA